MFRIVHEIKKTRVEGALSYPRHGGRILFARVRGRGEMSQTFKGKVNIEPSAGGEVTIVLDGSNANVHIGPTAATQTIHFNGSEGNIALGGNGQNGDIALFPAMDGSTSTPINDTTNFGNASIRLNAEKGTAKVGGLGTFGNLSVVDGGGHVTVNLDAFGQITIGGGPTKGVLSIKNESGKETVRIDGGKGDIFLSGADCAEQFEVVEEIECGTVMVIDDSGVLRPSDTAYDRRVAGVVAGGGGLRPGMVLGNDEAASRRAAVALAGRVYCKADASFGPIQLGDLMTTSPNRGHAMRAGEPLKAFGSVIGKALKALPEGTGLIPILVALQ
jgi:hypothetical protein